MPIERLNETQQGSLQQLRDQLQMPLRDSKSKVEDEIVKMIGEIVKSVLQSGWTVTGLLTGVLSGGYKWYQDKKRREGYEKCIAREIHDLFDPTQSYEMDPGSVRHHLEHYEIKDPAVSEIDHMYSEVWNQLQGGRLRDICYRRNLVEVAEFNVHFVLSSMLQFRTPLGGKT